MEEREGQLKRGKEGKEKEGNKMERGKINIMKRRGNKREIEERRQRGKD